MTHTLPNRPSADSAHKPEATVTPSDQSIREPDSLRSHSVAALMRPLEPVIEGTHSLRQAAELIALSDDAFAVVKLSGDVVGILSAEDVLAAERSNPTGWQTQPCTSGVPSDQSPVAAHHTVADVLAEYRRTGVRTLLVCQRDNAIGLLRCIDVRTWCQDHDPLLWEDLFAGQERQNAGEVDPR
ncbi:CBS domain-containing protein [Nesterenkonia haasae]|uniref:CBS domain-containing protein n=1 Tax=Nesterenkonia haasae TaxID=2587813 RepID=UPI001390DF40|nr:CBS domain-containing protein [Nesterenkonia haasae]NDK32198.1 CBS domain-containing protein [Nesterenkonia haasae]